MTKLANKWAFITGAGSGIGYEISLELAKQGCNLVITDINQRGLSTLADAVIKLGRKCWSYQLDVANAQEFASLAKKVVDQIGCPDIVINNAGLGYLGDVASNTTEVWQKILDVNVMGVVNGCQSFLPYMNNSNQAFTLVNVASAAARTPMPNMSAYAASKYAVEGFTDVLRMELAESAITVLCVYPGVINTNITNDASGSGANITTAQVHRLQSYYNKHGAHPRVVGKDVVTAIIAGDEYLFTGPQAKAGAMIERLLPKASLFKSLRKSAQKVGYLD